MEKYITSEQKIKLDNFINDFVKKNQNYKIIYLTLTGSKLYGIENENSDTDIKGIFLPSKSDLILSRVKHVYSYSSGNNDKKIVK